MWTAKHLDIRYCYAKQDSHAIVTVEVNVSLYIFCSFALLTAGIFQVLKDHPELRCFQSYWPIRPLIQQYLKNSSEQARESDRRRAERHSMEPTFGKKKVKKSKEAAEKERTGKKNKNTQTSVPAKNTKISTQPDENTDTSLNIQATEKTTKQAKPAAVSGRKEVTVVKVSLYFNIQTLTVALGSFFCKASTLPHVSPQSQYPCNRQQRF